MAYAMSGNLREGKLVGKATTESEGRGELTLEWEAERADRKGKE